MNIRKRLRKTLIHTYKEITLHRIFPACWRHAGKTAQGRCAGPLRAVFLEEYGGSLSDNCRVMAMELKRRGGWQMQAVYLHRENAGAAALFRNSIRAIRVMAGADVIFLDDSSELISALPLPEDIQVVQLWHACGAFKKFGYSLEGKIFGADRKELQRFPRHRNFTLVTVSAQEVIRAYAQAFAMEDRETAIRALGIPRTDLFFSRKRREAARAHLYRVLPGPAEKNAAFSSGSSADIRILLYAPTFRGSVADASAPESPDFSMLRRRLGENWIFLIKQHPYVKHRPAVPESCRTYVYDVTDTMPIDELLMVSHVCVSDYSSLVFEYSLMERPLLFYAPDLDLYQDWRGFYYPYEEMTPGPVVRTQEELAEELAHLEENFDRERIRSFRERFMAACDGHAARRIAGAVEGKAEENQRKTGRKPVKGRGIR